MERRTFLATAVAGLSAASVSRLAAAGPMPMRKLGRTGLEVSLITLGGFHMRKAGEDNGVKMIHRAMDLGINFLDSAHKYHQGRKRHHLRPSLGRKLQTPEGAADVQGSAAHRKGGHGAA